MIVVDANATAKWYLNERGSDAAALLLQVGGMAEAAAAVIERLQLNIIPFGGGDHGFGQA